MKQCSRCNALFAPRLDECPFCDGSESKAPQAWVRVRSKTKTRQMAAVEAPPPALKRVAKQTVEEIDPISHDMTVEMSAEFLAEHSSEILAIVDGTDEAFRPRDALGDLWSDFQDNVPTAQVRYLGEDDPDSYDLSDLVDPPTPAAIDNLLATGSEAGESEGFFVDLGGLDELSDWAVASLEAPATEAETERVKVVTDIVAKSRALARSPKLPSNPVADEPVRPPPAPTVAPLRDPVTQEVEEWQLEGEMEEQGSLVSTPKPAASSAGVARVAGFVLALTGGWAFATGVSPVVCVVLVLGAAALLLLPGRT